MIYLRGAILNEKNIVSIMVKVHGYKKEPFQLADIIQNDEGDLIVSNNTSYEYYTLMINGNTIIYYHSNKKGLEEDLNRIVSMMKLNDIGV